MQANSPLVVENLSVNRSKRVVLDDVSLTIERGEFVGLVGPNGGGKTTFLLTILGILKPIQGSVELFGSRNPSSNIFRKIGWVSQHASNIPKNIKIKSDTEQTIQTKKTCCFFKPCSITKIFCAPIANIKLSPVKNPKIRNSI